MKTRTLKTRTGFQPRSASAVREAIGENYIDKNDEKLRTILFLHEIHSKDQKQPDFAPLPLPEPGDWLAEHHEPGQTVEQYILQQTSFQPTPPRNKIYVLPLGKWEDFSTSGPSLEILKAFGKVYLGLPFELLPPAVLQQISSSKLQVILPQELIRKKQTENPSITWRINDYTHNRQLYTRDIADLLRRTLPHDAYCMMAITMEDLYPDPAWNFVFGEASLAHHVGVFSFARYHPWFYCQIPRKKTKSEISESERREISNLILRRSCKVMVHELLHLYGIHHCIFFHCCLNGSNSLEESDKRPLHLCPVELHKLVVFLRRGGIQLDLIQRYRELEKFYASHSDVFQEELEWVQMRLNKFEKVWKEKEKEGEKRAESTK